jgi:hypothetical protein
MVKCGREHGESALGTGCGGKKPHGPGKKGTKRSVAVEPHRLPAGIVLDGANRRDIKLLEETLRSIVTAHPEGINVYHLWMNRFRKLLARYEKKARNDQAFVEFACTIIIWRNVPIHPALIPG